tara:strand:- start:421 stop:1074 length:654 start_codon:yes stop_codon:yes gene_type:complete
MAASLVIFDCDGVLVDSEMLGNHVFAEMLSENGHRISAAETVARFRGMKLATCLEILQNESGVRLPESFETELRRRMSDAFRAQLRPVKGAPRLIRSMSVPFCVASSGPRSKIEDNLRTTKLYAHFENAIFSAYEIGSWKPDPGLFLAAARHYSVAPEDCIVIEDSSVGVSAGKAANMTVLGLSAASDDESVAAADQIFSSLDDIHNYFVSQQLACK